MSKKNLYGSLLLEIYEWGYNTMNSAWKHPKRDYIVKVARIKRGFSNSELTDWMEETPNIEPQSLYTPNTSNQMLLIPTDDKIGC